MTQSQAPQHAGVRIDEALIAGGAPEVHADVDPIPWRTGKVGVVPAIDAVTWSPVAPEPPVAPAPAKTCSSGSGAPCACSTSTTPASPTAPLAATATSPMRVASSASAAK